SPLPVSPLPGSPASRARSLASIFSTASEAITSIPNSENSFRMIGYGDISPLSSASRCGRISLAMNPRIPSRIIRSVSDHSNIVTPLAVVGLPGTVCPLVAGRASLFAISASRAGRVPDPAHSGYEHPHREPRPPCRPRASRSPAVGSCRPVDRLTGGRAGGGDPRPSGGPGGAGLADTVVRRSGGPRGLHRRAVVPERDRAHGDRYRHRQHLRSRRLRGRGGVPH